MRMGYRGAGRDGEQQRRAEVRSKSLPFVDAYSDEEVGDVADDSCPGSVPSPHVIGLDGFHISD
jgi:hypothetical protein